jgi:hypothetical protein
MILQYELINVLEELCSVEARSPHSKSGWILPNELLPANLTRKLPQPSAVPFGRCASGAALASAMAAKA